MENKHSYIYILASKRNGTLYIGVTNNLLRRIHEHKKGIVEGFTKQYGVHYLVYYEEAENPISAIEREKQLKQWHRQWKINLIQEKNPEWKDLSITLDPEINSG
jgi:putative endonuclease